ncbi:BlaI/MecI/CopY family transcriptional regulator [Anaerophilus nitritogenes]|uniref:BlaI/MecI/CopY family transcriptional regulator n=1 Tax=Anaerophilus nitritogenes TaxID=2498136 RepID=UPI00101C9733|nr:BlaI/MecI/CopY family transcriptional regulator [Anaerophilus nitritogenes]
MKFIPQVSDAELEILKVLWKLGPSTSSQIVDKLKDTSHWKAKTIQTLITRLVSKEALSTDKINGKAFIYSPNFSEKEYKSYANETFLQKIYNGSIRSMLTSFIKEQKLTKKDIDQLKQLLDEEE